MLQFILLQHLFYFIAHISTPLLLLPLKSGCVLAFFSADIKLLQCIACCAKTISISQSLINDAYVLAERYNPLLRSAIVIICRLLSSSVCRLLLSVMRVYYDKMADAGFTKKVAHYLKDKYSKFEEEIRMNSIDLEIILEWAKDLRVKIR